MKAQLLDALKAKFEGVNESILNRIATNLAKTVTEEGQVTAAIDGVTFQKVLDSYGDSRATEAQQTAISNYEKKHGLKDGQKVEIDGGTPSTQQNKEPEKPAGVAYDMPDWAKAILDANKAITDRLNQLDTERTTASRRQQLSDIIQKLPDYQRKAYERTPIDDISDDKFAELMETISTEVDGTLKEMQAKGVVFGKPTANNGTGLTGKSKEATEAEAQAVVDKLPI